MNAESSSIQFRPLRAEEVEVRVGNITTNGCSLLLYKTARTDMDLLDEVVGPENWQNEFVKVGDMLFCRVGIRIGSEWVWKSDTGVEGNAGEEKSQASDARKRAGFAWGIGRELYRAPFIFINVPTEARRDGRGYQLKGFPKFDVTLFEATKTEIQDLEIVDKDRHVVYRMGKPLTAARKSTKPAGQAAAPAPASKQPDLMNETFEEERAGFDLPASDESFDPNLAEAIDQLRRAKSRADINMIHKQYRGVYGEYAQTPNDRYMAEMKAACERYPRQS